VIVQPSLCLVIVKTDRFKRIGINTDDHVAAVTPVGHPQDSADDSGKKQGVCSVPSPLELDAVGLVASGKQALDFLFRQSATPKPVACSVFSELSARPLVDVNPLSADIAVKVSVLRRE